ncbi:MAG: leucine-rich repeat domain-containing protein [Luteolibacter sp.]
MASPKKKSLIREIIDDLKEQRTLFALMLAYAGVLVTALFNWQTLSQKWIDLSAGKSIWILYAFAFLPVLVPVAVVIFRRWRTASLERRLADVGKPNLTFKHGHFRTSPYSGSDEDRSSYKRTDHAHEQALDRIRHAAGKGESFFFLHSQSGCGKTSLLQAFVIPALEGSGWRVISLRGFTGILPELAEALGMAESATPAEIRAALATEAAARNAAGGTLLLAIDQFEEFLILHPPGTAPYLALHGFFTTLRATPVPGLLALLSLRSEYQTPALKLGLPDFDSARSFVVPLFTAEDAREFLRNGLQAARKKTGELPLDQFIRQMEDRDDTRGMIRPIQANLVGHAYRTYAAEFHTRLIAGKRVDFLADWLRRLLERRELRLHARPVFEGLLQKDGSRCPARVSRIASEARLDPDVVRHCLSAFQGEGLVRCLTPDLPDDREKLWEISHDFLAVQIKRALSFWRRLWQENIARALAPAAIGLWFLFSAGFFFQDTDRIHISRLAELGIHWKGANRTASVHEKLDFDQTKLASAGSSLKTLECTGIDLSNCAALQNVDGLKGLKGLTALTSLNLSSCFTLQNVDGLKGLTALTSLDLSYCSALQNVDALEGLTALTSLDLSDCNALQNVDGLQGLTALASLDLFDCDALQNVDALEGLTALAILDLSDCDALQNVDGFQGLKALASLDLFDCNALQNVDGLEGLTALASLNLSNCGALQNVDGLKGLTALAILDLAGCGALQNVDGLEGLTALARLNLSNCDALQNVDVLKGLTALASLDLSYCGTLQNVDGLEGLTALTSLGLSGCGTLRNLDVLEGLTALASLNLSDCEALQNVDGLEGLTALTSLVLSGCDAVQNVDVLKGLAALTSLDLSACDALQNVDGLESLTALTNLHLSHCDALQNVDGLMGLKALREIGLEGCPNLSKEAIQALEAALPDATIFHD